MEYAIEITLVGILLSGICLHIRGMIREARYHREFRSDLERFQKIGPKASCQWFVDASGEFGRIRRSLPKD